MTDEDSSLLGALPSLPDGVWDRLLAQTFEAPAPLGDVALIPAEPMDLIPRDDFEWFGAAEPLDDAALHDAPAEFDDGAGHDAWPDSHD